jgi:hypothetical protein
MAGKAYLRRLCEARPATRFPQALIDGINRAAQEIRWRHRKMIKHPSEADFDVQVSTSGVVVTFKPTKSVYTFSRLADPNDIARHGPILPGGADSVWHAGPTGDTSDYYDREVERMARDVVLKKLAAG